MRVTTLQRFLEKTTMASQWRNKARTMFVVRYRDSERFCTWSFNLACWFVHADARIEGIDAGQYRIEALPSQIEKAGWMWTFEDCEGRTYAEYQSR